VQSLKFCNITSHTFPLWDWRKLVSFMDLKTNPYLQGNKKNFPSHNSYEPEIYFWFQTPNLKLLLTYKRLQYIKLPVQHPQSPPAHLHGPFDTSIEIPPSGSAGNGGICFPCTNKALIKFSGIGTFTMLTSNCKYKKSFNIDCSCK
jgi:hypothetical protein